MPVEVTFIGESLPEILGQMYIALVDADYIKKPHTRPEPEPAPQSPMKAIADDIAAGTFKGANGAVPPPVAETQPVEPPAPEPEPPEVEPEPEVEKPDAVANEKIKNEVIRSLEAIHRAGRVDVIRSALYKYGNGAKSFLEIDATVFPAIKEALARGEIA
jgi:hypothetical protein